MELAIVVVGVVVGLLLAGGCAVVLKLVSTIGESQTRLMENNTSFKELAKSWSMHAQSHTDIELEKYKLLVDGVRNDVGDIQPRAFVRPAPAQKVNEDGLTATFENTLDPMG